MTSMLTCGGEKANFLQRAASVGLNGGTANSLFPLSRVYDDRQNKLFLLSAASAAVEIEVDLNELVNGSLDSWADVNTLNNWTKTTVGAGSTATKETTIVAAGNSLKLVTDAAGGSLAKYVQVLTVRSGESRQIEAQIRGTGTVAGKVGIHDLESDQWWNGATHAWGASVTYALSRTTGSFARVFEPYTVPAMSRTRGPLTRLEIVLINDTPGTTVYIDSVFGYPAPSFCAVSWHNWGSNVSMTLASGSDPTFSDFNTEGTLAAGSLILPSFYLTLGAPVPKRSWRIRFLGWNASQSLPQMAEVMLGQHFTLTGGPERGLSVRLVEADTSVTTQNDEDHVTSNTVWPRTDLQVEHVWPNAAYEEWAQEVFGRSRGRRWNFAVVPDSGEPFVYLVRLPKELESERRSKYLYRSGKFTMKGLPYPSVSQ